MGSVVVIYSLQAPVSPQVTLSAFVCVRTRCRITLQTTSLQPVNIASIGGGRQHYLGGAEHVCTPMYVHAPHLAGKSVEVRGKGHSGGGED